MFDPVYLKSGDLLPGGKYVLIQTLGRGAMGIVFWAKDQHLHRDVALKFLSERARQYPEVKQRFLREARALAKIKNPHVVQVYEVSSDDADELFIAMEHLVGADLGGRLASGFRPGFAEGIELGIQACKALAAAHEQGIVHRDLKPSNLFLTRDGVLKVVDFGVSKVLDEPRLTRTGEALGTPYYMSPEQVRCEEDIDQRTDIWSLGVILYELLSGTRPFEGTTIGEVMYGILSDTPRTLSSRGVRAPAALDELIQKCLEKDRSRRFQDVRALARALSALSTATPSSLLERSTLPLVMNNAPASSSAPSDSTPPPIGDPPEQFARTLASEPSPAIRVEPRARPAVPVQRSPGRGMYALGGALAGAALATAAVLAAAWSRRDPAPSVHALAPAPPSVSSPNAAVLESPKELAPPPIESTQPLTSVAHVPPAVSAARLPARPLPSARSVEAVRSAAPAPAPPASATSAGWLPSETAGAAVSPYAEQPKEP